jgi:hypothetical protein
MYCKRTETCEYDSQNDSILRFTYIRYFIYNKALVLSYVVNRILLQQLTRLTQLIQKLDAWNFKSNHCHHKISELGRNLNQFILNHTSVISCYNVRVNINLSLICSRSFPLIPNIKYLNKYYFIWLKILLPRHGIKPDPSSFRGERKSPVIGR